MEGESTLTVIKGKEKPSFYLRLGYPFNKKLSVSLGPIRAWQ